MRVIAKFMSNILDQEGLLDPDLLGGVHMVMDVITIEAIEEGLVDPDDIEPMLCALYDAYEEYQKKQSIEDLCSFENALVAVGSHIGPMPRPWVATALGSSLETADQWVIDYPRYAEGIYSAVTLIAQKGGFGQKVIRIAKSLMINIEELEDGKVNVDQLITESHHLAEALISKFS